MRARLGSTEPRLWTRPLRRLVPATSRGFEVVRFAEEVLGVHLYPWQRWLLIHGLELLEDGTYRFRRVIVLVARQNGKSLVATVLACWWLFVESRRHPERVPPIDFKVLGTAQNIDIARGPWERVKAWCDPDPETDEAARVAIPMLQEATSKVLDSNGKEQILAKNGAHYQVRASASSRGKPGARVIMDELREHKTWQLWNAVTHTSKNIWSSQVWGISNAGDAWAIVLKSQRDRCLDLIEEWDQLVEAGGLSPQEAIEQGFDASLGLFEWSAPDDCPLDDVEGLLSANPSIGHGNITVESCLSEAEASRGVNEAGYRTEVLCQWVVARKEPYVAVGDLEATHMEPAEVAALIPPGARTVWGVDTSLDRRMTSLAAAVFLADGRRFVTVRAQRFGMLWVKDYLLELAERSGHWEVAVQAKGCPAAEFPAVLEKAGLTVHAVDGSSIGLATGRFKDRVRDLELVTVPQPLVRMAAEGGQVSRYAENFAWSREKSSTDVSPLIAETVALWGLEACQEDHQPLVPPPPAALLPADGVDAALPNLANVRF